MIRGGAAGQSRFYGYMGIWGCRVAGLRARGRERCEGVWLWLGSSRTGWAYDDSAGASHTPDLPQTDAPDRHDDYYHDDYYQPTTTATALTTTVATAAAHVPAVLQHLTPSTAASRYCAARLTAPVAPPSPARPCTRCRLYRAR